MAAALRTAIPTELLGTAAICPPTGSGRAGSLSGAITPFTRRVSSTRTPWVPPSMVSLVAAGSQRNSGACTRRSLSICCVQVKELLLVKALVAAMEPTKNWAKCAVVAVMPCSNPMLPVAKGPAAAAFWICRSAAALWSRGVSTKLVAVRLLMVRSVVGSNRAGW